MGGLKVLPSTVVWTGLASKTIEAAHHGQKGRGGGNSAETQRHSVGDAGQARYRSLADFSSVPTRMPCCPAKVTASPSSVPPREVKGVAWGAGWRLGSPVDAFVESS